LALNIVDRLVVVRDQSSGGLSWGELASAWSPRHRVAVLDVIRRLQSHPRTRGL